MKKQLRLNYPATALSFLALLTANLTFNIDIVHARFGGGFGGFHGGGFGGFNRAGFGGDFRGGSLFHSDGDFNRPTYDLNTGQSARTNFSNFDQNRTGFQQSRQNEVNTVQQNRTDDLNSIQQNRTNTADNLQQNRTNTADNLQQNRINTANNLQQNRQNYWNSSDWNHGWYYPGWGCCDDGGWGAAGLATGLALGATLNSLPSGYATIPVGTNNYYYDNGSYYLPSGSGYQVVAPPVNAVIPTLPFGFTKVYAYGSSTPYYYYNGAFYSNSNGGYSVVQPPEGVMVPYLPKGHTTKVINGTTYDQYGGVTYRPYFSGGEVVYIVSNP